MQILIESPDFHITQSIERFVRAQAKNSFTCCSAQLERVVVKLRDLNGPKGGVDKQCSVMLTFTNQPPVIVTKTHYDAYATIRNSIARAARVAVRKITRRRRRHTGKKDQFNSRYLDDYR